MSTVLTMVRWLPLAASFLLLAGCTSSTEPVASIVSPLPEPAPAPKPWQDVMTVEGQATGVGYLTPVEEGPLHSGFIGAITVSYEFELVENATRLTFNLTWDTPADLYLEVGYDGGSETIGHEEDRTLTRTLDHTTQDVAPGAWWVAVLVQGPAAVHYDLLVTVDYAS